MPRGTAAERLAARLDTSITFVKADGTTVAAQLAAVDKGAVAVEIAGDGGTRGEGMAKLVMLASADVERGYMFALADGSGGYIQYRIMAANPPARSLSRTAWAEVVDS